jgi:putative transposase
MKKSTFTDEQIAYALKQAETGTPVAEVIRRMGIAQQTFYRWKKKYEDLPPSDVKKLRQLEEENRRLKQMVADLSLDKHMLQEVLLKKSSAVTAARNSETFAARLPSRDPTRLCGRRPLSSHLLLSGASG